jgi:hypothetical protein
MIRRLGPALVILAAAMGTSTVALGDPDLPDISPHRHFVQTGDRLVQVGPRVCDKPALQAAFNQFHSNGHIAVPGSTGPAQPAPGLHNGKGGEITSRPCSFVAR